MSITNSNIHVSYFMTKKICQNMNCIGTDTKTKIRFTSQLFQDKFHTDQKFNWIDN